MGGWEKFSKASLPKKIMEDITNADYMNLKSVCKEF